MHLTLRLTLHLTLGQIPQGVRGAERDRVWRIRQRVPVSASARRLPLRTQAVTQASRRLILRVSTR